jgi:uncharacterized protein YndB with AHSA1/START domain
MAKQMHAAKRTRRCTLSIGARRRGGLVIFNIRRQDPQQRLPTLAITSAHLIQHVDASRSDVYRALLDARAVAIWMVPGRMSSRVREFNAREGVRSAFLLLTTPPAATGKTSMNTDAYHGRFVKLVPDEQVIEVMEFETSDPEMRREMTVTYALIDAGGTDVLAAHGNLPPGLVPVANEIGWRIALDKLARFIEGGP